jgi:ribosome-binding ATPase YchF (GTP1/OBG family)
MQINDLFCDAQVEAELRELDPVEAAEYLESLGASEGGLASLIRTAYRQLGLLTYFTTGGPFLS